MEKEDAWIKMDPLYRIALWLMFVSTMILAAFVVAFFIWDLDKDTQLVFYIAILVPVLVAMIPIFKFSRHNMSMTSVMNGEDYDNEDDRKEIVRIRKAINRRYTIITVPFFLIILVLLTLKYLGVIPADIPDLFLIAPLFLILCISSLLREVAVRNAKLRC